MVKDWTDNAFYIDAPDASATYLVYARCSSAQSCIGSASTSVSVGCPNLGSNLWTGPLTVRKTAGLPGAEPDQNLTIGWNGEGAAQWTDVVRGNLIALRTNKTFVGSVVGCSLNKLSASTAADNYALAPGGGFYFIGRGAYCNVTPNYYRYEDPKAIKFCSNNNALPCFVNATCGTGTCTVTKDPQINGEASTCP